ncbi:predicted protein [Naegleria gruberi]|uniref:Predicted protein n=1 Tax=Naegleria gruberi TaxID=5762 RepID=D2V4R3_NAEGR|nr:uncharacterized protein NAEGRDRAFT_63879 [Naegleria gruberi]EFC47978.1 predicted protein [Naegleria gruberi]|eukprot:XP_002680722.1 predicted protein [Naegleria gruberi strain NEG-M]
MSCTVLAQPYYQSSSSNTTVHNNNYRQVDEESGYFPSGRNQDFERFKRYFGSSILFLIISVVLTMVVFFLYMADCVFQGLDGEGNCEGGSMIALIISSLLVISGALISIGLCLRYRREAIEFWNDLKSASVLRGTLISNAYHQHKIGENVNSNNSSMVQDQSEAHLETSLTLPISPIKLRQSQMYDDRPIRSFEFPPELALPPRKSKQDDDDDDDEIDESSNLL